MPLRHPLVVSVAPLAAFALAAPAAQAAFPSTAIDVASPSGLRATAIVTQDRGSSRSSTRRLRVNSLLTGSVTEYGVKVEIGRGCGTDDVAVEIARFPAAVGSPQVVVERTRIPRRLASPGADLRLTSPIDGRVIACFSPDRPGRRSAGLAAFMAAVDDGDPSAIAVARRSDCSRRSCATRLAIAGGLAGVTHDPAAGRACTTASAGTSADERATVRWRGFRSGATACLLGDGSVRAAGRVRPVSRSLIDTSTGEVVWADE